MNAAGRSDVAVVGGGIVGLCTAGLLARSGRAVTVLDEWDFGGTTANAGSLHVQMQSRFMRLYPDQVPRLEASLPHYPRAVAAWKELQAELGADFELKQTGGLMVAEDAAGFEFLRRKCARERGLGLDVDMLDRKELLEIAPYLNPAVHGAELCRDEGKLNPLAANAAIRDWVLGLGVRLSGGSRVLAVERGSRGFVLKLRERQYLAGEVVLAAAAGTRPLAAGLGIDIPTEGEPLHMNITEPAPPLVGHLVQHADRQITLKQLGTGQIVIGGGWPAGVGGRRDGPVVLAESLIANSTLAQYLAPGIAGLRIIRTWSGYNTTTDGASVLGAVEGVPGLYVAIPGDAGYTLAPYIARALANLIVSGDAGMDLAPFSPMRFRAGP